MIAAKTIWSSTELPTLPSVAIKLLELSKKPDTTIQDMVDVLRVDPALTAKFLQTVNSAYYGLRSQVVSIDRAASLLGMSRVTTLALSFSLAEQVTNSGPMQHYYNAYWLQSVVQAVAAEVLSQQFAKSLSSEFFLIGLLADVGRLAMLRTIPDEYRSVLETAENENQALCVVELDRIGIAHTDVSAGLLEKWNLPGAVIQATRHHHASISDLLGLANNAIFELVKAVAVSSAVGEYQCSPTNGVGYRRLRDLTEEFYGFTDAAMETYLADVRERLEQVGDLFDIDVRELPAPLREPTSCEVI